MERTQNAPSGPCDRGEHLCVFFFWRVITSDRMLRVGYDHGSFTVVIIIFTSSSVSARTSCMLDQTTDPDPKKRFFFYFTAGSATKRAQNERGRAIWVTIYIYSHKARSTHTHLELPRVEPLPRSIGQKLGCKRFLGSLLLRGPCTSSITAPPSHWSYEQRHLWNYACNHICHRNSRACTVSCLE